MRSLAIVGLLAAAAFAGDATDAEKERINRVVQSHAKVFRECFKTATKNGKVVVHAKIDASGHVTSTSTKSEFETGPKACILQAFKKLEFGAITPTDIDYPLMFAHQ
ncbi:MAG: AgmX/PglI C-terminal domain-containing protein [Kofleriaceae bacterium]